MSAPSEPIPRLRHPRGARVRTRAEFSAVFEHGRRLAHPLMSLHWSPLSPQPKLGLAVSRKVDPHAVGRNRIKRALRERFRMLRAALAPGRYVVVARPAAAQATSRELREALEQLLRRAGALPVSPATGTMPAPPAHP